MRTKYNIISIGDATLDTHMKIHDATVVCSLKRDTCQLCLNWADKIPVTRIDREVAGNAANNAVGSSRLALSTAFYSVVGDDDVGARIIKKMRHEQVSTEYLVVQKHSMSNVSVVLNFQEERTILVYHHPRKYHLPALVPAKWVYLTSLGKTFAGLHRQVARYVTRHRVKLAFNPGTHQLRAGLSALRGILKYTSALFVNKEEAESLVGAAKNMKTLLGRLRDLGPPMVIITDAERGAFACRALQCFHTPAFPMKVIEKTGAGDAFASACIAALCYDRPFDEALRWGAANAAAVIQKIGPQAGLLTRQQMNAWLKKFKRIQTSSI